MERNTRGDYRDLVVWHKSVELAKLVHQLTANFPARDKFGLTAQLRRAAISVPSNIAEGQARRTTGEFVQFISNAERLNAELHTELILSIELGCCNQKQASPAFELVAEIRKMLKARRRALTPGLARHSSLATRHLAL